MNADAPRPLLRRQLQRERKARKHAETLLEHKSLELFQANAELREQNACLSSLNSQLETAHLHLLQADKLASIGQLAAGVAHEINNPIGFILCNLGTLERYFGELLRLLDAYEKLELPSAPPAQLATLHDLKQRSDLPYLREDSAQLLEESRAGIERVRQIVQNLRDFSRVDHGSHWQAADLEQNLEATLNILAGEIPAGTQVVRQYGRIPEVECQAAQLNQVFLNLLLNAAQAIQGAGNIWVRSGREGERVWIEIEDNGCGIAEEHRARLFEPFFSTKPVGQGSGLGLAVAFGIVQAHHGELQVHSAIGQGSRFRLCLPIHRSGPSSLSV